MFSTQLTLAILVVLSVMCVIVFFDNKKALRAREAEEARRQRDRDADEREGQVLATRRVARERARIAYPQLLDLAEADRLPSLSRELTCDEEKHAGEALDLLRREEKLFAEVYENFSAREKDIGVLATALMARKYGVAPEERPSQYLDRPARIIDCDDAGKIELFTPAQIEAARDRSGYTEYANLLECCAKAPEVADRIIGHVKARDEMIERKSWETDGPIVMKISDLPPLPNEDRSDPL